MLKIILFFIASVVLAQNTEKERSSNNAPSIQQEGQFVSLRISKKQPIQIFVMGKHEASLDLSTLKLYVRRKNAKTSENMPLLQKNGYFIVDESFTQPTELRLRLRSKTKKMSFIFTGVRPI